MVLPSKSWSGYEKVLRTIGERRAAPADTRAWERDLRFLQELALVEGAHPALTATGQRYFDARFIEDDGDAAKSVLLHQLLEAYAPAQVITQTFANRPQVPRGTAETVLRSQGIATEMTDRRLGALLALMHLAGAITYSKQQGSFRVLATPLLEPGLPSSIFISKDTPWSNRRWLHRLIAESDGHVFWLDKHWLPAGMDILGEAADGQQLTSIKILSLQLPESVTRSAKRAYRDLGRELHGRGIDFEWRFVDSRQLRDTHDRWIISQSSAWNVPNLNAILSGQNSEFVRSSNRVELQKVFEQSWTAAPARPFTT